MSYIQVSEELFKKTLQQHPEWEGVPVETVMQSVMQYIDPNLPLQGLQASAQYYTGGLRVFRLKTQHLEATT